jgi:hypothetical protein
MGSLDQPPHAVVDDADHPFCCAELSRAYRNAFLANPRVPESHAHIAFLEKEEGMELPVRNEVRPGVAIALFPILVLSALAVGTASAATRATGTPGVVLGDVTPQVQQAAAPVPGVPPRQRPPMGPSPLGTGFAGGMVPVRLHVDLYRTCMVVAPHDWVIYGSRREGDALDIMASDQSMAASYGVAGAPGSLARLYPHLYGTAEARLHSGLSAGGRVPVVYGQPMRDNTFGYTWLPFEIGDPNAPSPPAKGVVLYRVWPIPNDPPGYILLQRRAQTAKHLWGRQGAQAISVALSIRCTRQLQSSPDAAGRGGTGDDRAESTYNEQLGMEYAHDAVTGENYWVSPSIDWRDTGPDGPGYYKRSGNEWRKLVPGRQ